MPALLRSLITHSLAVVTATIILPIFAVLVLSLTNSLSNKFYYKFVHDGEHHVDSRGLTRFPLYASIIDENHGFADAGRRNHSHNYLAPYVIPPISIENANENEDSKIDDRERDEIKKLTGDGNTAEGIAALRAAEIFRSVGKESKAERLFEHALALCPTHPDVLTSLGLFAEESKQDMVTADYFYTRALLYCPEHALARTRRQRTRHLVRDIDGLMLVGLDRKRQRFLGIPRNSYSFHEAARDAYIRYIYHTVAIEGNTMSLTQTRSVLQTRLAVGGKSVLEHNEILGVDAALKYINSSLVYRRVDSLTVDDVLEIHRRVLGYVDPIEAGRFRTTQVYVGRFEPPPPEHVREEMEYLTGWFRAESTLRTVHPVEVAALMHYKFVAIHPFVDGNGRTARLLMNLILMQAGFPPVVIRLSDRGAYYDTLKAANDGDVRPFIRFIARCTERTLDEYLKLADGTTALKASDILFSNDDSSTFTSNSVIEDFDDDGDEWRLDGRPGVINVSYEAKKEVDFKNV